MSFFKKIISILFFASILCGCKSESNKLEGTEIAFKNVEDFRYSRLGDSDGYLVTVKNDLITFNFTDHIEVNKKATWFISNDLSGNNVISSSTIYLNEGQPAETNFTYLHVSNKQDKKTYAILLHRNYKFTVKFYDQIANRLISTSIIEEGHCIPEGEIPNIPTSPDGYTYTGWDFDFNSPVRSDRTIYLRYTAHITNVSLDPNGGHFSDGSTEKYHMDIAYNSSYSLPLPTKDHHRFLGWFTTRSGGTEINNSGTWLSTKSYETFYAHWEINRYSVTWKNGNVTLSTETYNYGDIPSYKGAEPTKEESAQYTYTFSGWSPTISAVVSNTTYTAVFNSVTKKYTVTWKNYDGTVLETDTDVPYGTMPSYNGDIPIKNGDAQYSYSFNGWNPSIGAVTGNVTYTAQFTSSINKYTVRYLNYDGSVISTQTIDYGSSASYHGVTPTKPDEGRKSYEFRGWDKDTSCITSNTDVYALYNTYINYSFTFIDESTTSIRLLEGQDIISQMPANSPKRITGNEEISYSWVDNGEYSFFETGTARGIYYITYNLNSGTNNESNPFSIYGDEVIELLDPTKTGYTFKGWYLDDEVTKITELSNITSDITLTAKWELTNYSITYHLDGGTNHAKNPESYTYQDTIELKNPSKTGYTFLGWYLDSEFQTSITIISGKYENLDLYAKFDVNQYTITFNSNGGAYEEGLQLTLDSRISGTRTFTIGYNELVNPYDLWELNVNGSSYFNGWYLDSGCKTKLTGTVSFTKDTTLYGDWFSFQASTKVKVLKNPIEVSSGVYSDAWISNPEDACFYLPPNITRFSCTASFPNGTKAHMYSYKKEMSIGDMNGDGEEKTRSYAVSGGDVIAIYSYPGSRVKCTITVKTIESTFITTNDERVAGISYGSEINTPLVSKTGFEFLGYYDTDNQLIDSNYYYESDKTFTASWQLVDYNINYHLDGGINNENNPNTFTIESNLSLLEPSKQGFEFGGWYTSPTFESQYQITTINGLSGDLDLYAKFTPITYSLTMNNNGGTYGAIITFYDGDEIIYSSSLLYSEYIEDFTPNSKEGYLFAGWYLDPELAEIFNYNGQISHDTNLYAKWIECSTLSTTVELSNNFDILIQGIDEQLITFVPIADCSVTISSQSDLDLLGSLYDENHNKLVGSDDISDEDLDFSLTYNLTAGDIYYLSVSGATVSTNGHATINVDWTGNCQITGTTFGDDVRYYQYGSQYYLPENVVLEGYTFVGWFDDDNNQYTSGIWIFTDNVSVHAVFEASI